MYIYKKEIEEKRKKESEKREENEIDRERNETKQQKVWCRNGKAAMGTV